MSTVVAAVAPAAAQQQAAAAASLPAGTQQQVDDEVVILDSDNEGQNAQVSGRDAALRTRCGGWSGWRCVTRELWLALDRA